MTCGSDGVFQLVFGVRAPEESGFNCTVVKKKRFRETFVFTGGSETVGWFPQILLCYLNFDSDSQFFLLFQYRYIFVFCFPHFVFCAQGHPKQPRGTPEGPSGVVHCLLLSSFVFGSHRGFRFDVSALFASSFKLHLLFQSVGFLHFALLLLQWFCCALFSFGVFFATSRFCLLVENGFASPCVFTIFAYSPPATRERKSTLLILYLHC